MIGSTFKVFGFFIVCFLILCIPVGGKPLFEHLFKMSTPVGKVIAEKAEDSFDKSKNFGERLFSNSIPSNNSDEIRMRNSSVKKARRNAFKVEAQDQYDDHSSEDQEALEKTIQSHY
ncbi:MAG: hypothetical protein ACOYL6_05295 [Bacteriovoracaceae bacterium]